MIARVWTATTTPELAPAYADYLRTQVFPQLAGIDGYEQTVLMNRDTGSGVEVQVITFWRSLDAVRAFSGPDLEAAVVTDAAAALLTRHDERTRHFEVVLHDGP